MKAVLDTSVLVAAFIADGVCRRLLLRARDGDFTLAVCPGIRDEFATALGRKAGATRGEVAEALALLDEVSVPADPAARRHQGFGGLSRSPRRPRSRLRGRRRRQTSRQGDKDLLVLKEHRGTTILSPRDFELRFPG